jgi:hypothetical protein
VLKQSQATRFAVSPALTQIADLDTATATREQLSDFYQGVRADKTILKRDTTPAPPAPRAGGAFAMNTAVFTNTSGFSAAALAAPAPAPTPSTAAGLFAERIDVRSNVVRWYLSFPIFCPNPVGNIHLEC